MVDTAGARLYMIDDGRMVDSMKVIVGKADPSTADADDREHDLLCDAQPLLARVGELVRSLIARNVLEQGLGYLKTQGYQVMPADPSDDELLDPAKVDWHAVAAGTRKGSRAPASGSGELDGSDQVRLPEQLTTSTCTTRRRRSCSRRTTGPQPRLHPAGGRRAARAVDDGP